MSTPITALVLSGGCLRGYAQIGVLKALTAAGIRPDLIVGVSVGAVIGALFAAGRTPREIEEIAYSVVISRLKRWALSRHGLWSGAALQDLLRQQLPYRQLEEFPTPFVTIATDATSRRAIVLNQGDAADAIMASAAMPGFFVPQIIRGRRYIDGCLVCPLPVKIAKDLGAHRIIAVNTLCDPQCDGHGSILDTLLRTPRTMMQALASYEAALADVVITPRLPSYTHERSASWRQLLVDTGERDAAATLRAAIGILQSS